MDNVSTQTAPTNIESKVTPVQAPAVESPKEDLITRASKVTLDTPKKPESQAEEPGIKLDQAAIDKIADPVLKASVQEAYKSMQADYTRKTQALAQDKATLKAQLESTGQYTPDKIQQLLNNPSFVQAAQEYQRKFGTPAPQASNANAELTEEEFSYLSPEQQKLYVKTQQMERTLGVVNSRLAASEVEKQDLSLKSKYANYESAKVDEIYHGMMNGTVQATREHLWKVLDYEPAVQRAYELGRQDRKLEMGEKVAASSQTNGVSVTPASDVPVRLPNESGIEYFKRIAMGNFAKNNSKK